MSARAGELLSAGLALPDLGRTPERAIEAQIPGEEVFSTANWFLADGRSARSAASIAHCEDVKNGIGRRILNLIGRRSER